MAISVGYIVRRFMVFVVTVWAAATVNFFVPRLGPGDPISAMLGRMSMQGQSVENSNVLIEAYREQFGLDGNLFEQYAKYMWSAIRLDFGYSLSNFPVGVMEIVRRALPWTLGLLITSTAISFVLGTLIGALLAWRGTSRLLNLLVAPLLVLASIPYYLLAIVLLYVLAFGISVFPNSGVRSIGSTNELNLRNILDVLHHSVLPALSIILVSIGGWMMGMRSMMVTVVDSDYLKLAQAKGLRRRRIFLHYAMRNAILPQITHLAIALGTVVAGQVLVEVIFSYPGLGFQLFRAISNTDYTVIQGITFILVVSVAGAVFVLDLIYPRLDPRITYTKK